MPTLDLESLKQTKTSPTWPKGFFFFSLFIFLIVLGIFFGLDYIWLPRQENILNELKKESLKIRSEFSLEQEEKVALFERRLVTLKELLNQHSTFLGILNKIEEITHPQVYYTSFSYQRDKNSLNLDGIAKDQYVFSEAISGFINHPEIVKTVIVRSMRAEDTDLISFTIEIVFNSNILKP